jgi:protein-S-isoprenylcysteine O-methyltransferase Ste14
MLVYFLYSIVVPAHLDTPLAITGLIIYIVGFVLYSAAWIAVATSGGGKVISSGPFRFSRHPIYVSSAVLFIGAGLVSESFLFLGLSLLVGVTHMGNALAEEKICLEAFGDEYRKYIARTPRWLGFPGAKPNNTIDP